MKTVGRFSRPDKKILKQNTKNILNGWRWKQPCRAVRALVAALESSFLQNNKERNKLIFEALAKAKERTGTNNLQFVGSIVVAPIMNEDGFMDVKKEMAAHISSPGQTVVDLFVTTLRALWLKNHNLY